MRIIWLAIMIMLTTTLITTAAAENGQNPSDIIVTLLALLFLAAVVFLIYGLIKPERVPLIGEKTRKRVLIEYTVFLFLILLAVTPFAEDTSNKSSNGFDENAVRVTPSPEPTKSTPMPTPEETLKKYVLYFNTLQTEELYNLMSSRFRASTSLDDFHNQVYALNSNGITIYKYEVITRDLKGDHAALKVRTTWNVMGYRQTYINTLNFTLENGEWKLDTQILPSGEKG